jgi:uncharacterized protein
MPRKKKMLFIFIALIVVVLAIAGAFWYFFFSGRANPSLPQETLSMNGHTFNVEIASTTLEQMTGLSYRPSLGENDGMLFIFGRPSVQNFWMKDMHFPLDMIWISGNTVAGFAENAEPQPGDPLWQLKIYTSPDGVDKVLEVNAGTVAKDNIQVGDEVQIEE